MILPFLGALLNIGTADRPRLQIFKLKTAIISHNLAPFDKLRIYDKYFGSVSWRMLELFASLSKTILNSMTIKRYLILSQISLIGFMLICCIIMPSVVITNGGVSNFGNHLATILPYTLSFGLNTVFIYLATSRLYQLRASVRAMANVLTLLCILNVLVYLSTFLRHFAWTFSDIHDWIGVGLFGLEFVFSVWIVWQLQRGLAILLLEFAGAMIGLFSALRIIHFLFIGQMVATVGFGLILVKFLPQIVEQRLSSDSV